MYNRKGKEAKTKSKPSTNNKSIVDIDLTDISNKEMEFYGKIFKENTAPLMQVGRDLIEVLKQTNKPPQEELKRKLSSELEVSGDGSDKSSIEPTPVEE